MYMQDFQSATSGQGIPDQDKSSKRSVVQREIVMQEADYRRSINEKIKLEAEVRQLKNDEAHIRISLQEKQTHLTRLEQEITRTDSELRDLKKKLNTL